MIVREWDGGCGDCFSDVNYKRSYVNVIYVAVNNCPVNMKYTVFVVNIVHNYIKYVSLQCEGSTTRELQRI